MENFSYVTDAVQGMVQAAWTIIVHGGWVIFLALFLFILFKRYMGALNRSFGATNKIIFLTIKVQRENLQSILAVEQIFAQLHATQTNVSFADKYVGGQYQIATALEIASIGGKISYIIQTAEKYRNLVEAAFYAQFPNAEISEVEDYMKNLGKWDPLYSTWDLWGTEIGYSKDYAYPIKTYSAFEQSSAEEAILDPLAGMLEALGKIEPHELMSVQYCMAPLPDTAWQPHIQDEVKKLKGELKPPPPGILGRIFAPLNIITEKTLIDVLLTPPKKPDEKPTAPAVQRLSEGEKNVLSAVEEKLSRPAWAVKIRILYIAPKDKFDNTKRTALLGAFRQFSGMTTNNFKPNSKVATNVNQKLFKSIEQPYLDYAVKKRKKNLLMAFVQRRVDIIGKPIIMNGEELATIFHFPLSSVAVPPVESIEVKKGQPPANLPIVI